MSWQLIRIFWLSLFALVLPAQALACLEHSPVASATVQSSCAQALIQQQAGDTHKPLDSAPTTESQYSGSAAALLNSVRWNISERYKVDDGDPDALGTVAPGYPQIDASLMLRFVQHMVPASYQHFHSCYRLSGWKETNALYVALNSHNF